MYYDLCFVAWFGAPPYAILIVRYVVGGLCRVPSLAALLEHAGAIFQFGEIIL